MFGTLLEYRLPILGLIIFGLILWNRFQLKRLQRWRGRALEAEAHIQKREEMRRIALEQKGRGKQETERALLEVSRFYPKRLINKSEEQLLAHITALLERSERAKGYQILAQVNYGEILSTQPSDSSLPEQESFWLINCRRADFCLLDENHHPLAVIEYQGEGHYQGEWRHGDQIKRYAIESAGLLFCEITYNDRKNFTRALQRELAPLL